MAINILVAEDNFVNRTLLSKIFKKLGYQVQLAEDGLEAVRAFENNFFDLVFMDIEMPGLDGFEATRLLRTQFKDSIRKPVIVALTANGMNGEKERCIAQGMDDFLAKPFAIEDVERIISTISG